MDSPAKTKPQLLPYIYNSIYRGYKRYSILEVKRDIKDLFRRQIRYV
jgi:hypothetical protein